MSEPLAAAAGLLVSVAEKVMGVGPAAAAEANVNGTVRFGSEPPAPSGAAVVSVEEQLTVDEPTTVAEQSHPVPDGAEATATPAGSVDVTVTGVASCRTTSVSLIVTVCGDAAPATRAVPEAWTARGTGIVDDSDSAWMFQNSRWLFTGESLFAPNPNRYVETVLSVAPEYPAVDRDESGTLICWVPSTDTMKRGLVAFVGETSTSTECVAAARVLAYQAMEPAAVPAT